MLTRPAGYRIQNDGPELVYKSLESSLRIVQIVERRGIGDHHHRVTVQGPVLLADAPARLRAPRIRQFTERRLIGKPEVPAQGSAEALIEGIDRRKGFPVAAEP